MRTQGNKGHSLTSLQLRHSSIIFTGLLLMMVFISNKCCWLFSKTKLFLHFIRVKLKSSPFMLIDFFLNKPPALRASTRSPSSVDSMSLWSSSMDHLEVRVSLNVLNVTFIHCLLDSTSCVYCKCNQVRVSCAIMPFYVTLCEFSDTFHQLIHLFISSGVWRRCVEGTSGPTR